MARNALIPAEYPFFDYKRLTFSLGIVAGGSAWLSGSTAARFDPATRGMVVEGDLVAQARLVMDKTRVALEAGGLGLADVVRLVQYVTPAALADMPKLEAYYREAFPGGVPKVCTIVVRSLLRSTALIEIEAIAGRGAGAALEFLPAASGADLAQADALAAQALRARGLAAGDVLRRLELLAPPAAARAGTRAAGGPATLRVIMPRVVADGALAQVETTAARGAGPVLYVSADGDPAAGDVVGQCREIYARIGRQLQAAGSGLDEVVKTTEFITPDALAEYRKTAEVRREVFDAPYPAATGVICETLPRSGVQIAVEVVAVRGSK